MSIVWAWPSGVQYTMSRMIMPEISGVGRGEGVGVTVGLGEGVAVNSGVRVERMVGVWSGVSVEIRPGKRMSSGWVKLHASAARAIHATASNGRFVFIEITIP